MTWTDRDQLRANDYNPNHVAPPELELLATSILHDGWTQPIVARADGEIVDGFHRWTVSGWDSVRSLTDGMVPVVFLRAGVSAAHQRASTIRHNRARGAHRIVSMSEIVRSLVEDHDVDPADVQGMLGMEKDEVTRLLEARTMPSTVDSEEFSRAWKPQRAKKAG